MARRVRVRGSRRQVWNGSRQKTRSGLSKNDFTTNKNGKLVSKKQHAHGKKAYKNIRGWTQAVSKARKALGITGFCAVKKGTPLYKKAREFYCAATKRQRSTTKRVPATAYGRTIARPQPSVSKHYSFLSLS
jgi:hypothetical protein